MTESGSTAPPPEPSFESVEAELKAVTAQLEDPAVALEERLQLHARAASMHQRLEAIVEAARKATSKATSEAANDAPNEAGPPGLPGAGAGAGEGPREPYEAVRDRLAEVVNTLENEDLPLARVINLHGEAQRLAARCEAILGAAQEQITQTGITSGITSGTTSGTTSGAGPGAPPPAVHRAGEDQDSDAPF